MTVFPDTNILLHYPPLKDIDWRKITDADSVKLVLCMQVIHELDEKKSDSRLASRAERAIKEIRTVRASGQAVRDGVSLDVFNCELRADDFPDTLSPDAKDDRIVHLVKKYMDVTGEAAVAICTEDYGMALRCDAHGIAVIEPGKQSRLETPQSELDRKYKAVCSELNALKAGMPKLDVLVAPSTEEPEPKSGRVFIRVYRQPQPDDVDEEVRKEDYQRRLPPLRDAHANALATMSLDHISDAERRRYVGELQAYLIAYRKWVEAMNEYKLNLGRLFRFRIDIQNNGGSPAEDVEVSIRLPPILQFVACEEEKCGQMLADAPAQPDPPQRPRTMHEEMAERFSNPMADFRRELDYRMPNLKLRGEPDFRLSGQMETGFTVSLSIPRLIHHNSQGFGDFYSMFRRRSDAHPFEGQMMITASNITEKIERTVPFIVELDE